MNEREAQSPTLRRARERRTDRDALNKWGLYHHITYESITKKKTVQSEVIQWVKKRDDLIAARLHYLFTVNAY